MTTGTNDATPALWRNLGAGPATRPIGALRNVFDRWIAASSLVANDPVLDVRQFGWTALLRDRWRDIRAEAMQLADGAPASVTDRDHAIACTFPLWRHGTPIETQLARCPATRAVVERIPGINSAAFSILAPGAHVPAHRGVTKGLITCHLGLIVPRDGDVRMRIADRVLRWSEGETLVFDDTYDHEIWNDTAGTRMLLRVQFERPLRNPGKWFADLMLGLIRRTSLMPHGRLVPSRRVGA